VARAPKPRCSPRSRRPGSRPWHGRPAWSPWCPPACS
jgi:hypothetical protein